MKQAVLGATGDVGSLLIRELVDRDINVVALTRTEQDPDKRIDGVEYATTDAEDRESLLGATRGLDVVYATLSVPYTTKDWQRSWPKITRNLIEAAQTNDFKLVFLDNVYMYGRTDGPMTEDSPIRPLAEKGKVRAEIAEMLTDAMDRGDINATIGRSADFYGPNSRISSRFFLGTLDEGKAYWMGSPDTLRTWSYVPDNARALAVLGNDERADQKVWHMPAARAMTGAGFVALAGEVLGRDLETVPVPGDSPEAREAFAKSIPELAEMMYQYDFPYDYRSDRFQETFGVEPTPYKDGFRRVYAELEKR